MKKIILLAISITGIITIVFLSKKYIEENYKETDSKCFVFNKEEGKITDYKEYCGPIVVIPSKIDGVLVTKIGTSSFEEKGLKKVIFSKNITEIGISAFEDNYIEEIKLNDNINEIKPYAFFNNKLKKLKLPNRINRIGYKAFNKNNLKSKYAFIYKRNSDFSIDKKIIIGYGGSDKDIKIPNKVEIINNNAFSESSLNSVEFNKELKKIEANAFSKNSLKTITISKNVELIGKEAFTDNKLEKIIINGKKSKEDFIYLGENWNSECNNIIYK